MPVLTSLLLAAPPAPWAALGFAVPPGGVTRVGTTTLRFDPGVGEGGIAAWGFAEALPDPLDGLATTVVAPPEGAPPEHPNGATRLDHVVVATPDLARTQAALAAAGFDRRRVREAGELRQAFYRLGEVILELVGPAEPSGDGPASFWGLVAVVPDLDALAARLGDRLGSPRDAVQPGRRIATVPRESGTGLRLAFMTG
jgi:hypothetical protein